MRKLFLRASLTLLIVFTTAPVGAIVPNGNWIDYSADYFSTIDEGNKVITIQNAAELALVARNASSALHWTFKDYTITLAGDINLAEHYWTPIGSSGCYFEGTFDGGNHTISGLTVKSSDTTLGLFGEVYYGTVKDVTLAGASISIGSTNNAIYIGGIAGKNVGGTIQNCHVLSDVVLSGNQCCGGIVGKNTGGTSIRGTIKNCTSAATVENATMCGGIAGANYGGLVSQCFYYGQSLSSSSYPGSIVGRNSHSENSANIDGTVSDCYYYYDCTGVGYNTSQVSNVARVYKLSLSDGIAVSSSPTYTHNGINYYKEGESVSLSFVGALPTDNVAIYTLNGTVIDGHTFSMPAKDSKVAFSFVQSGSTYTIYTTDGWNEFCNMLANSAKGYFTGKTVKLGADISISRMAGPKSRPFTGTFDGQGHAITMTLSTSSDDIAPFCYTEGVTIRNLVLKGSISTSCKYAGSLACSSEGTCLFTNCVSSVTINSSKDGDGTHGGLVAYVGNGTTTISGCAFTGSILGEKTVGCGGFVGWVESNKNAKLVMTDCLFAPAQVSVNLTYTFSRARDLASLTINNCYYTKKAVEENVNYGIKATVYPSTASEFLKATVGSVVLDYGLLQKCTRGLKHAGASYTVDAVGLEGDGTESSPCKIKSTADWNRLVTLVAEGTATSGAFFQQTETIGVTTMLGTPGCPFGGTYNGLHNVLMIDIESTSGETAPFANISGAVIRDIAVGGTLKGGNHCAGLVCVVRGGTNLIQNCLVNVSVTTSGDYCGGIVGHGASATTALRGCLFNGSITGGTYVGTLWGWSDAAKVTITDCLDLSSSTHPIGYGLNGTGASLSVSNTYYTNPTKATDNVHAWTGGNAGKRAFVFDSQPVYFGTAGTNYGYIAAYTNGLKHNDKYYKSLSLGSFAGSGTSGAPYQIQSTNDWILLGEIVDKGVLTTAMNFKLMNNIGITTTVGTVDHPFNSIFDGGGKLLTLNINSSNGEAPFKNISGATIRNLKVDGTLSGGNHSAALAGVVRGGTNVIENCVVTTALTLNGDYGGGIVAHGTSASVTLRGCVFAGSITGGSEVGTLWGWSDAAKVTITDCLDLSSSTHPIGRSLNGEGASVSVSNTYYTNTTKTTDGSHAWTGANGGYRAYSTTQHTNIGAAGTNYGFVKAYANGLEYGGMFYWHDVTPGDANCDGSITVTDIAVVVNCILQLANNGGYSPYGADANGDGQITVTDIGVIVDKILGVNNNSGNAASRRMPHDAIEPQ